MHVEQQLRAEICEIGRRLYTQGFAAANDGNISVKVSEGYILTTPTGVSKGYMTPEMMVKTDLLGNVLEGRLKPSSELKMHLRVYELRPDVHAVVHAHPPYATAHAIVGEGLTSPIIAEAVVNLGAVPLAPYANPSTEEVPESVAPFVGQHNAVLLANHGALSYGPDLTTAWFRMETLEHYAKLQTLARQIGQPNPLSKQQVQQLKDLFKL